MDARGDEREPERIGRPRLIAPRGVREAGAGRSNDGQFREVSGLGIRRQVEEQPGVETREDPIGRRPELPAGEVRIGGLALRREVAHERGHEQRHRSRRRGRARGAAGGEVFQRDAGTAAKPERSPPVGGLGGLVAGAPAAGCAWAANVAAGATTPS